MFNFKIFKERTIRARCSIPVRVGTDQTKSYQSSFGHRTAGNANGKTKVNIAIILLTKKLSMNYLKIELN